VVLHSALKRFARDDSGATAVEYAIIAGLIFLVIIAAVAAVGTALTNTFNEVATNLT
jgi:pilus assembly protein Flp/PilA